jgi:hypothetical protein
MVKEILFSSTCDGPTEQTSLLVQIDNLMNVSYIPLVKYGKGVRLALNEEKEKIMSEFYDRSALIKKDGFIEGEYGKFAKKMLNGYLLACSGFYHSFWKRLLNKITGYRLTSFFVV